jgi:tetratricopeptide (TPR) repeat protein
MTVRAVSLAVMVCVALASSAVRAEPTPSPSAVVEAGKHFQRGVTMYNEADYRAALVEFRRAYETAPNAAVLYNIGQTYYQLQNYAAALVALGRYLTEAGASAAHRREVEATIDTLQTRVGKVAVTTNVAGCDVTVDDELVGKTPLDEPVLVSIGRRKITALRDGRVAETRYVDVAAGDTVNVALSAGDRTDQASTAPKAADKSSTTWGWYLTGGLGVVAIATGTAAYLESRSLSDARGQFHASASDLNSKSNLVKWLSRTADVSGALALIGTAVMVKITLSRSESSEAHVAITPTGIRVAGQF